MRKFDYRSYIGFGLLLFLTVGLLVKTVLSSQLLGQNKRYNLVWLDGGQNVSFVSFDPAEKRVLIIDYPADLAIKSRSVGSYRVGDLARLGGYEGLMGEFVRRKVQGFMKVPIANYLVGSEGQTSLSVTLLRAVWLGDKASSQSRLDLLILVQRLAEYEVREVGQEELVRAGVMEDDQTNNRLEYQAGRLQQFLGTRVFDWSVGERGWTVALVNESGIPGLATDVADFLTNGGMDVVAVRSGEEGKIREKSEVLVGLQGEKEQAEIGELLRNWFGWNEVKNEDTNFYRSEVVIKIGKDAAGLF